MARLELSAMFVIISTQGAGFRLTVGCHHGAWHTLHNTQPKGKDLFQRPHDAHRKSQDQRANKKCRTSETSDGVFRLDVPEFATVITRCRHDVFVVVQELAT